MPKGGIGLEPVIDKTEMQDLAERFENANPEDILREAVLKIPKLTIACSFGAEDMVILHIAMNIDREISVFYLDTDLLFQETYELRDQAIERYGIKNLLQVKPDLSLDEQVKQHGEALWARDPDLCCNIRKIQPLKRTLAHFDGWVTGIRREQSPTRKNAKAFEYDDKFGLVKVNPLALWTNEQVWTFIKDHDVPYNALHKKGYPSIGCYPCTKPIRAGEDPRSGRWAGMKKTECGLHQ